MSHWQKVKHLYFRAGFGPSLQNWRKDQNRPLEEIVSQLFSDSQNFQLLTLKEGKAPIPRDQMTMQGLSKEEKDALRKQSRNSQKELNAAWITQMAHSKAQLREKMTLFWHDHFACQLPVQYFVVLQQNNVLRKHALGKFGDLLHAVSKDAGMLRFLNNQQNRKDHPNENFAREVMELFTLGRGNYTEKDIQEAARAFTGWSSNMKGDFIFRKNWHDTGEKTFLGRTGNFGGADILNILLKEKQTARYLTEKIYRFFVHQKVDEAMVDKWAEEFYQSDYDVSQLLRTIFTSDHFYQSQFMGHRVKSPVEYLAGMMRMLDARFPDEDGPIFIQKVLGQILFRPPNVAGWPDGRSWIDSSSLMARMRIPQAIIFATEVKLKAKADFAGNEDGFKMPKGKMVRKLNGEIQWEPFIRTFLQGKKVKAEALQAYLLQVQPQWSLEELAPFTRGENARQNLKLLTMRMMCTPEFQLC